MAKKKTTKKNDIKQGTHIENCTFMQGVHFDADTLDAVEAIASAIEANAMAANQLASVLSGRQVKIVGPIINTIN